MSIGSGSPEGLPSRLGRVRAPTTRKRLMRRNTLRLCALAVIGVPALLSASGPALADSTLRAERTTPDTSEPAGTSRVAADLREDVSAAAEDGSAPESIQAEATSAITATRNGTQIQATVQNTSTEPLTCTAVARYVKTPFTQASDSLFQLLQPNASHTFSIDVPIPGKYRPIAYCYPGASDVDPTTALMFDHMGNLVTKGKGPASGQIGDEIMVPWSELFGS
jgi:hypothetical protein